MKDIRFDLSGLLAEAIGNEAGLSANEIRDGLARGTSASDWIRKIRKEGQIGFLDIPSDKAVADRIAAETARIAPAFENVVVLGIGGSGLGCRMLQNALLPSYANLRDRAARRNRPRLFVYDNVDPAEFEGLLAAAPPEKTLYNVISKSGTTVETLAAFLLVWDRLKKAVGAKAKDHVVLTTDPAKGPLREISKEEGILAFDVPANVGGRFSVLSAVGLVPAALAGIDIRPLLAGAERMAARCLAESAEKNPGICGAVAHVLFASRGRAITAMMPYVAGLRQFSEWFAQLWAESLGKRKPGGGHAGLTPAKALGVTDQHSQLQLYLEGPQDKVVGFLAVDELGGDVALPAPFPAKTALNYLGGATLGKLLDVERRATEAAFRDVKRPSWTLTLPRLDGESLGQAIVLFEHMTAAAGHLLGIDPFDQPAVEIGKRKADATLGKPGSDPKMVLPPAAKALPGGWVV